MILLSWTGVAVCLIAALAAAAQAVSGFGFAMLGVPLMIPVLGVQAAVVVVTALSLVLTVSRTVADRHKVRWRPVLTLSAVAMAGIPIGLVLLVLLDPRWLAFGVGVVVIGATALLSRRTTWRMTNTGAVCGAGLASGVLLSATGINGPPVVAIFQTMGLRPVVFRASLQAAFVLQDLVAIIGFVFIARLTLDIGLTALAAAPAVWVGWWFGDLLFRRIGVSVFRIVVLWMLLISGLLAVVQAIAQLLDF